MPDHRVGLCDAVVGDKNRHKIEWAQLCQNRGVHEVQHGVKLCGIHYNAGCDHPIRVVLPELKVEP